MSEKRYIKNCKQCGKEYVASSSKSVFDTVACRSRWHREKQGSLLKAQAKTIRTQTKIIKTVLSKVAHCEACGKQEKIERLTHIGLKKHDSLLCYECWGKKYSK